MAQSSSKKPPPYHSEATHNKDDAGHLLAIEPSVLQPLVRFRRTSLLRTYHETYGRDEYDRTSIRVDANRLALPQRGARVYHDEPNKDAVAEEQELADQLKKLSVAHPRGPREQLPPRPETPCPDLGDPNEDRTSMFFKSRRPGTPLPSVFLDSSDTDDEDVSAKIPGAQASPQRFSLRIGVCPPELERSDDVLSDDSEGPITPPAYTKLGFNPANPTQNTKSSIKPDLNPTGCLGGF